MTAKNSV